MHSKCHKSFKGYGLLKHGYSRINHKAKCLVTCVLTLIRMSSETQCKNMTGIKCDCLSKNPPCSHSN